MTRLVYWGNGKLRYKSNYKNGKKDGAHFEYFPNGDLLEKGNYKNGKKISD